jgi:hypothetical protein
VTTRRHLCCVRATSSRHCAPPTVHNRRDAQPPQVYAGAALMLAAELVNLAVHLQLRGMRPSVRRAGYGGERQLRVQRS